MEIIKELVTTFLGDRLINILKAGTNKIADEVCHFANNKILEYLSIEYERNSKTKTILHRSEPVDLNKFYQPLFLLKNLSKNRFGRLGINLLLFALISITIIEKTFYYNDEKKAISSNIKYRGCRI
ncbi:MAG: hypothetical protein V8Q94_01390 [Bacteroides stercoris]